MMSFRIPLELRDRLQIAATKHGREVTETLCALLDQALALDDALSAPRVKKVLERTMNQDGLTLAEALAHLIELAK